MRSRDLRAHPGPTPSPCNLPGSGPSLCAWSRRSVSSICARVTLPGAAGRGALPPLSLEASSSSSRCVSFLRSSCSRRRFSFSSCGGSHGRPASPEASPPGPGAWGGARTRGPWRASSDRAGEERARGRARLGKPPGTGQRGSFELPRGAQRGWTGLSGGAVGCPDTATSLPRGGQSEPMPTSRSPLPGGPLTSHLWEGKGKEGNGAAAGPGTAAPESLHMPAPQLLSVPPKSLLPGLAPAVCPY